jgi:hypothetical protein
MMLDRSYLVLAAAVGFAVLAGVEARRGGERAAAPVAEAPQPAPPVAAPPPLPVTPPEPLAQEIPGLQVEGRITDPRGGPIPGASVSVADGRGSGGTSDASGSYALRVELREGEAPSLRFSATGYQDVEVALEATASDERLSLDVRLEPAPGAVVSGTLRSERGEPIEGETVQLSSRLSGTRYRGVSDSEGRFRIPGVGPHAGYYLSVRPSQGYRDYQTSVDVSPDGASIDIRLQGLVTTRLTGRLVDSEGRPIPDLDFAIVSGQALGRSIPARTDRDGSFSQAGVPTGYLSLLPAGAEGLAIADVLLRPGADAYVTVRADWGDEALAGRVVADDGRPLGGAEVELTWAPLDPETVGRSRRTVVTASDVRAAGYEPTALDYEIAPDAPGVEVELAPARGAG